MELHILDCSNYIYAGSFSKKFIARGVRESNNEYQANEAPIGGVRFLLRQISSLMRPGVDIMPVFDRVPEIKREMYANTFGNEGYKANRPAKKIDITGQQAYAEQILRDVGFPVQAVDGYEADDVIYSLVRYYKNDYEKIYIHTKDSDLFFLVDTNVSIAKVGDQGKEIDIYSYPLLVKSGEHTLYNTVHLRKLCRGDTADNIPGVGWDFAEKLDAIVPTEQYAKFGDLDLCREYIKRVVTENPTMVGGHNILRTFNILCPLLVNFEELNDIEQDVDTGKWGYYMSDWSQSMDRWGLEEMLADYIESYYE